MKTNKVKSPKVSDIGESGLIRLTGHFNLNRPERIITGIGDDCAVIRNNEGKLQLLTTDVMIDGVHFLRDRHKPQALGEKLLAISLSDIAAMGGEPREAIICAMLTADLEVNWLEDFYTGLNDIAKRYNVNIVGGDTSQHPDRLTFALTLTGIVEEKNVIHRSGGKPGDLIFVSGTIGNSDAGLQIIKNKTADISEEHLEFLINSCIRTEPRVELGQVLSKSGVVTAMTDISDGLAVDLPNICRAGGTGSELIVEYIPISSALKDFCKSQNESPIEFALKSGGDYELLWTINPNGIEIIEELAKRSDLPPITHIGRLVDDNQSKVTIIQPGGQKEILQSGGWQHFSI
ncbi:MAG: thiamine-phosphate kinase [Candidatus Hatepunaea meridiana]|nr:thiamine-phosphate kinase [Candidatus Hatepunaea meridiana]